MEILKEKENLISLIDLKIHRLLSLKCDYCNDDEISRFCKLDLKDKVEKLSSIMDDYVMRFGIVLLTISCIIGIMFFVISFAISKNVILSLGISIVSLFIIWIFIKNHKIENTESGEINFDIEYEQLTEVDTVKRHYDFWNSDVPKIVEVLADNIGKTNVLTRLLTNMFISTSNYATFKTRYYDNVCRIFDFYTKVFDDIWLRNKNVNAEEFVDYFVKNTSAWSCRKETYQMIMFNCTELTFWHLFLSVKGFNMSIYGDDKNIRLCIDEFMRCIKENDNIDELTKIDKFLTLAINVDDYCQQKLDNINSICN